MPGQSHINQSHLSSLQRITAPNATHSLQQSIPYRCAHGTGTQQSTINPVSLRSRDRQSTIEAGLWDLAGLTPWIGGSAVYTARIILGYDPDEHGIPYRIKDTTKLFTKNQNLLVYPNPTSDLIYLKFKYEIDQTSTIKLYDFTGKNVLSKNIPAGVKEISMDISDMADGLYLYIVESEGFIEQGKLIKIKK